MYKQKAEKSKIRIYGLVELRHSTYKSTAAVLVSLGKIEIHEYEVPEIKPNDMLLEVEMAGICGTDVHMIYSRQPFPGKDHIYPQILGHETVGTIAEMGSEASKLDATGRPLEIGDRVTLVSGEAPDVTHPLLYGWGRGWAEYRYIHGESAKIYKIPHEIPPQVGVLVEPMSIGVKAVERALEPTGPNVLRGMGPGKSVIVQGSGPIGLMVTILTKLCGAHKIAVVGAPQTRLDICSDFGADYTINIDKVNDPEERIAKVRDLIPEGADVVFEAAGVPAALTEGLEMVREGGVYVEIGHFTNRGTTPVNPYVLCQKDINLYGSWGGGPHGFMISRRIIESYHKSIPFEKVVTHKFPLEEAAKAIEKVRRGECMKTVLVPK